MRSWFVRFLLVACAVSASLAHGEGSDDAALRNERKNNKKTTENRRPNDPEYGVTYSTKLDFDSTLIEGRLKAPAGFFLQGRSAQSLTNMVKLRSNFKTEMRNSRAAVKALVR